MSSHRQGGASLVADAPQGQGASWDPPPLDCASSLRLGDPGSHGFFCSHFPSSGQHQVWHHGELAVHCPLLEGAGITARY